MVEFFDFYREEEKYGAPKYVFIKKSKEKAVFLYPSDGITKVIKKEEYDDEVKMLKYMGFICKQEKEQKGGDDEQNHEVISAITDDDIETFRMLLDDDVIGETSKINGKNILGVIIENGAIKIFKWVKSNGWKIDEELCYLPQKNKEEMISLLKISSEF